MISNSSPYPPPSSDPALFDDWQFNKDNPTILPSSTHSDDLEGLHLIQEEATARHNKEGTVIRHRAWTVDEALRSDIDHLQETPLRPRSTKSQEQIVFPSSPPFLQMPGVLSSPMTYPSHSSPPTVKMPPLGTADPNRKSRTHGAFLADDSEDEEDTAIPVPKRRMLEESVSANTEAILLSKLQQPPSPEPEELSHTKQATSLGAFIFDSDNDEEAPVLENAGLRYGVDMAATSNTSVRHPVSSLLFSRFADRKEIRTCSGKVTNIRPRQKTETVPFEKMVAARSTTKAGRAKKSYYGIDIHQLIDDAGKEILKESSKIPDTPQVLLQSVEQPLRTKRTAMWTEKYRARRFFDLVGDDRTHREVLRWLKGWDPVVFPRAGKPKVPVSKRPGVEGGPVEKAHRKILLLTGPPGLGKTTLAHVCAMQAGYEIMEINASDERSSNVVKGRIRTSVGTESVRTIGTTSKDGKVQKLARPVCVVVDEVDGVVSGSGGSGEGGFIKALIDLVQLDAKNTAALGSGSGMTSRKKKGDSFRLLRPLILICNDVYHPSLRPLRQSSFAEIIHIRTPPIEAVTTRMKTVFEKEGIACDSDGVRKLCEATWGMSSGPEARFDSSGTGEGDLRSVLVVGEWVAGKLKSSGAAIPRLTKKWVDDNMLTNLSHGGQGTRGVGRGGAKEVVSRVFLTGAGFPKPATAPFVLSKTSTDATVPRTKLHDAEIAKKAGMDRLREMVDTSGEIDRIVADVFSVYPSQPFNDDTVLSKPDSAYEWLHFYDSCSTRVHSEQDWELMPYLSQTVLACHHLFASPSRHYQHSFEQQKKWDASGTDEEVIETPFSGPRADYDAREAEKLHKATIMELQANLNAPLLRSFRSPESISTDLLPYLVRMLTPEVKPIVVGGSSNGDQRGIASVRRESEREMVRRAVDVMSGVGVTFERGKLEGSDFGNNRISEWVYRMQPPLDTLVDFPTACTHATLSAVPVRYAVRQVLDQAYQKNEIVRANAARQMRYKAGNTGGDEEEGEEASAFSFATAAGKGEKKRGFDAEEELTRSLEKRDFFGRLIVTADRSGGGLGTENDTEKGKGKGRKGKVVEKDDNKVWITFHEGYSNAVRKPVTVLELLRGL